MRAGRLLGRRNAHQTLDLEAVGSPHQGDEGVGVGRDHPGLLGLLAGVDLDVEARAPALLLRLLGQSLGQLLPVKGLDHVEDGDRLLRLVRLQGADEAQLDVVTLFGPAGHGFLHPVLAEHPLAGGQHRLDPLPRLLLGDGDQGHIGRIAVRRARRCGDALADGVEANRNRGGGAHWARTWNGWFGSRGR